MLLTRLHSFHGPMHLQTAHSQTFSQQITIRQLPLPLMHMRREGLFITSCSFNIGPSMKVQGTYCFCRGYYCYAVALLKGLVASLIIHLCIMERKWSLNDIYIIKCTHNFQYVIYRPHPAHKKYFTHSNNPEHLELCQFKSSNVAMVATTCMVWGPIPHIW